MAHHEVDRVVSALEGVADLKPACDALFAEMPEPKYGSLDAGVSKRLAVLPGYSELKTDPQNYFVVLPEITI